MSAARFAFPYCVLPFDPFSSRSTFFFVSVQIYDLANLYLITSSGCFPVLVLLLCREFDVDLGDGPDADEYRQCAGKDDERLAKAVKEAVLIGDDELTATEVIHKVSRLDGEDSPADSVKVCLLVIDNS